MAIRREFLSGTEPPLERVAQWLVDRFRRAGVADLSRAIVVVPGGRAGRLLRQLVLAQADQMGLGCFPPLITTVGRVPELLYETRRPLASSLVQQLAWSAVLQQMPLADLAPLTRHAPAPGDSLGWLQLAALLAAQHSELAAEGINFQGVLEQAVALDDFQEHARWELLANLQQRYWRVLDEVPMWDRQTARLVALERGECRLQRELILVGTVDLSRAVRMMIDQIADQVTALVVAPSEDKSLFDAYGCLNSAAWQAARISVDDSQWIVVDGPRQQADAVARWLSELGGTYRADEIAVGVPDSQLVPWVQESLRASHMISRYGAGQPLGEVRAARLLASLADSLQYEDFACQASLVRHVDVGRWLHQSGVDPRWEVQFDEYHRAHLPARELRPENPRLAAFPNVRTAIGLLDRLTEPLRGAPQPLHRWAGKVTKWLRTVYANQTAEDHHPMVRTLEHLTQGLAELEEIPATLSPMVTAVQAIRILLQQLSTTRIPPPTMPDAIQLLGWLELPLDSARAIAVTGVNEGIVPQAVNGDVFLPDRLRRQLGIEDNRRRYARDAYALRMILHGRRDVRLISGRQDDVGNPLLMSRLLSACEPSRMAVRSLRFWGFEEQLPAPHGNGTRRSAVRRKNTGLPVPLPQPPAAPIERFRVTDFAAYLRCPYRFYLERVLKLSSLNDELSELDPLGFGSFAHEVLCRFGQSDAKDSGSEEQIRRALRETLDQVVSERLDGHPLIAARVQVEQLWHRLRVFARKQAEWRNSGWRIHLVEVANEQAVVPWPVDGQPVILTGRIDRVDIHEDREEWMLWDYKTSDESKPWKDAYKEKEGRWVDLQLPLYRHLCQPLNIPATAGLGYISLPKSADLADFHQAPWTEDHLKVADQQAAEIVQRIRRHVFWPPGEKSLEQNDALAAIYQAGVLDRNWPPLEPAGR